MSSNVLVVYFSRTGHTASVAAQISTALGADLEVIRDSRDRRGLLGWFRSGLEATLGIPVRIAPLVSDPKAYDLVVVGTPVWDHGVSSPVRSFFARYGAELPDVAFFLTCGSSGQDRTFAQMERLARQEPVAKLALRERDVLTGGAYSAIDRFAGTLRAALRPRTARGERAWPPPSELPAN